MSRDDELAALEATVQPCRNCSDTVWAGRDGSWSHDVRGWRRCDHMRGVAQPSRDTLPWGRRVLDRIEMTILRIPR